MNEMDESPQEKRKESANNRENSNVEIPILPLALGAGALMIGVVLLVIVSSSSKKRNVEEFGLTPGEGKTPAISRNLWIRVDGISGKTLGLADDELPASVRGFRPSAQVSAPAQSFDIQQHEVTWEELDGWLVNKPGQTFPVPFPELTPEARKTLPATGVPWTVAREYCQAMGGALPTEEQWEWAARGQALNRFAGGNAAPDFSRLHAFKGDTGRPAPVMSNPQDRTEGAADKAIYDLMGNAQEWTSSVWRDDLPGNDLSWVNNEGTVVYAIRGFPVHRQLPARIDELSLAYRDWICATGDCSPLSAGAPPRERARRPKIELWPGADSTQPAVVPWRKVLEKPAVVMAMSKCFFEPTSAKVTIDASKESFCPRAEHVPANGKCDGQDAYTAPLVRMKGELSETTLKCVNYAFHNVSVANVALNLPEVSFSYALHVETNPLKARDYVGFRCVREVAPR